VSPPPSSTAAGAPAPSAAVHGRTGALVLLVLLTLIWGFHWVVVKTGLDYIPPFTFGVFRVGLALATFVLLLGTTGRLRRPDPANRSIVLSVGLGQIAVGIGLQVLALQVVDAGRSAVLVYTMPLWVAIELAVVFGIMPRRAELVGLVLGIAGLVALLNPASVDWSSTGELLGTLGLLLNAAIWAAVTIHVRRHRWTQSPLELQPWMLLVALAPLGLLALVFDAGSPIRWEPITFLVLLYSGPLATAFAFWASQAITRSLGAQVAATGFLATPVVGLASGAIVLGEALTAVDVVGFGLILAGVGVTALLPARAPLPGPTAGAAMRADRAGRTGDDRDG
jgi:drug/metabolite transporter (DMT)-like permease